MAPPEVIAASRAPRRGRNRPLTWSWCKWAPRRPRRVENPSASIATTSSNSSRVRLRNGSALRMSSKSSSSSHSPAATSATICCDRISSGFSGMSSVSSSLRRAASITATHSTSSSRLRGKRRPFGTPPMKCPERPTLCSIAAIVRVEPSWQTRSTSPMSMPSSRDAVATMALRSPAFSLCSDSSRCSRDRLP